MLLAITRFTHRLQNRSRCQIFTLLIEWLDLSVEMHLTPEYPIHIIRRASFVLKNDSLSMSSKCKLQLLKTSQQVFLLCLRNLRHMRHRHQHLSKHVQVLALLAGSILRVKCIRHADEPTFVSHHFNRFDFAQACVERLQNQVVKVFVFADVLDDPALIVSLHIAFLYWYYCYLKLAFLDIGKVRMKLV